MILLIVYDLDAGRTRRMIEFTDPRQALVARFVVEEDEPGRVEAIVLTGESIEAMKRTHGKYFAAGRVPDPPMSQV